MFGYNSPWVRLSFPPQRLMCKHDKTFSTDAVVKQSAGSVEQSGFYNILSSSLDDRDHRPLVAQHYVLYRKYVLQNETQSA